MTAQDRAALRALLAEYPFTQPWKLGLVVGTIDDGKPFGHAYSDEEVKARRALTIGAVNALGGLLDQVEELERERDVLRSRVYRVRPDEDGRGGETWQAFGADMAQDRDDARTSSEQWRTRYLGVAGALVAFLRTQPQDEQVQKTIAELERDLGWKEAARG